MMEFTLLLSLRENEMDHLTLEVRMRAVHYALLLGLALCLAFAVSGCGKKDYPPELLEAKAAVAESKAEGADNKCPEEYKSAENMLAKAEAFYAGNDKESMGEAAKSTIKLADTAKDCAAKKAAVPPSSVMVGELPKEMADYKETIYFKFNDNSIQPSEVVKLKKTALFAQQYQGKYKFWMILTAHADRPGDSRENFELSRRRGIVVRQILIQSSVEPDAMLIKPVGEAFAVSTDKKTKMNQEFRKVDITFAAYNSISTIKFGSPFLYEKYEEYKGPTPTQLKEKK
jgi:outer membrane protein OmpA-like peptidoglycan-associated protein